MLGEVTCTNLVSFFEVFILNRNELSDGITYASAAMSALGRIAHATNSLANTQLNISAHYDISNEMFASFLSPDMTYSCAIWAPKSTDEESESLEDAQIRKLRRLISNTRIQSTDHVLEIGTGWGSLAIEAVRQTGCRVTSLTLSVEQKALADKRIAAEGFSDRITVVICDYRALPAPNPKYDKIISIEMLEAVGGEFLETYFACVDRLLKQDTGIAAFQCITMPENRYDAYNNGEDFIRKYIFPGGHLPTTTKLIDAMTAGSKGTLIVESVENIGGHYCKTLRLWREEFMRNFDMRILPALRITYPDMTAEAAQVFKHKWEYYFAYCEAGFRAKSLGDVIITVAREGCTRLLEDIPL
jgi:cyclopropane-fatty-acyl-phospholipid synthase